MTPSQPEPAEVADDPYMYVVCAVMPWSSLQLAGPFMLGSIGKLIDESNPVGFMPVFKTRADAQRFKDDAGNGPATRGEIMVMTRVTE